jgi:predicted amidohydrolase
MTATWRIAGVQMDVRLAESATNLQAIRAKLAEAAQGGARLVVFPECALSGYCFRNRAEVRAHAEPVPGPSSDALAADCARLGIFAVVGMLEAAAASVYNSAVLIGPAGVVAVYRKTHLPCLGADRFVDPGQQPYHVYDLGGLRVGVNICFDASFPEVSRILTLLGADLIVLPTNWADNAIKMATLVPRVRALENHVYYLAVNRVGWEGGYHFIGHSSATDYSGNYLCYAEHDQETLFLAEIEPAAARQKRLIHCVGEYEIDRVNWRRPELYGPLVQAMPKPFTGHRNTETS